MATKRKFYVKVDRDLRGFVILLKSAACEWVLLCLLLIYAAFSHFLTKFSQYCNLQLPCIICSRLDHVLGKGKPNFYKELLCTDHALEISSLVSCKTHGKLADVNDICEECLLSFAMKRETSLDICKFLIGKLGLDGLRNPIFKKDFLPGSLRTKSCSCCGKQWRCRPNVQKLVHSQSFGGRDSKPDIPLPSPPPRHKNLNYRDRLKRDRLSPLEFPDFDSLSHVGYREVRISSDSESDIQFSDEEDPIASLHDQNGVKDDPVAQQGSTKFSFKRQFDECFLMKQINWPHDTWNNLIDTTPEPQFDVKSNSRNSVPSDSNTHNEIKWQLQAHQKHSSSVAKLMSLDDIPLSSSKPVKADEAENAAPLPKKFASSGLSELISMNEFPPSKGSKENDDIGKTCKIKNREAFILHGSKSGMAIRPDQGKKETTTISTQNGYTKYSTEVAPNSKPIESSQSPQNQHAKSEKQNGLDANVRATSAEASSVSIDDSSLSDQSSFANGHTDEFQFTALSGSKDIDRSGQKTPLMERSQSYESLDGSNVSNIEGELLVDRLKRQVDYDRKCITRLRKELEEERNASTEAANQAMAMITKLQEEKAALNMEALQYLRMMEEQAEHDMDALEKANDMLAEKEKEIQDFEAELDFYRLKYPNEFEDEFGDVNNIISQTSELLGEHLGSNHLKTKLETESC